MKTSKLQQASLFDRIKQQKLLLLMLLPGLDLHLPLHSHVRGADCLQRLQPFKRCTRK